MTSLTSPLSVSHSHGQSLSWSQVIRSLWLGLPTRSPLFSPSEVSKSLWTNCLTQSSNPLPRFYHFSVAGRITQAYALLWVPAQDPMTSNHGLCNPRLCCCFLGLLPNFLLQLQPPSGLPLELPVLSGAISPFMVSCQSQSSKAGSQRFHIPSSLGSSCRVPSCCPSFTISFLSLCLLQLLP